MLPSAPVNFRFSNLETSYGILHWDTPEVNIEIILEILISESIFFKNILEKNTSENHEKKVKIKKSENVAG